MNRQSSNRAACALSAAIIVISAMVWALPVRAHDVITTAITWNREISRIFKARCISCHDVGATVSLTTYKEAFAWKTAIRDEVLQRTMPPWGAVKGFGDFRNDQALTPEQLEIISSWAQGGAPEGDPQDIQTPTPDDAKRPTGWDKDEPHYAHPAGEILVSGDFTIRRAFTLDGIWPKTSPPGASFRITAQFPNGRMEPLLWLMDYKPKFGHPFLLRTPLVLPAGTVVQGVPKEASVLLLPAVKAAQSKSSSLTAKPVGK